MGRIISFFQRLVTKLLQTSKRFPLSIISLCFTTVIIGINIENVTYITDEALARLLYTGIFSFFLSVFVQFIQERFRSLKKNKILLGIAVMIITVLYYFFMTSFTMGAAATIRLFIICFALLGLYMYIVSYKEEVDFNHISLSHLKAFFISTLYSLILFLGLLAIYYAVDLLLVELDSDIVAHIANIVFIIFAPSYYLSMLPKFNEIAAMPDKEETSFYHYPKFLEILVSYIMIPLITAYTAVLILYFIKILIEMEWPIGQIGPMVLIYSAAGLIMYILCNELNNRFAVLFRKLFPFAHIPLVILQLISVGIRLNAYGFTESRYYVTLFGIYSIVCSLYLILSKKKNAGMIVFLSACFALFSIIPPVDAFRVSRLSQTQRVEMILESNGMLIDGQLIPKENISNQDKDEIRSIIFYMADMGHLEAINWLPEDAKDNDIYRDFDELFGFSSYGGGVKDPSMVNASLDMYTPLPITGNDIMLKYDFNYYQKPSQEIVFDTEDGSYTVRFDMLTDQTHGLIISDSSGADIQIVSIDTFLRQIGNSYIQSNDYELELSQMSFDSTGERFDIHIIFEYVYFTYDEDGINDGSGSMRILLKKK